MENRSELDGAAAAAAQSTIGQSIEDRADAIEHALAVELDRVATRSVLYQSGDADPTTLSSSPSTDGRYLLMGQDPRLQEMPARPTLIDFFKRRFRPYQHLLQSARLAKLAGHDEKIVLACLLHDISMVGLIRCDHGYWGAQLVAPYVDEEIAWAIRYHQALRFFPDESVGYDYPELYVRFFGPDYHVPPYIRRDYDEARRHRWYMTSRLITLNDIYAFDPTVSVSLDDFADVIGRHFRQPAEGLGFDNSPSAHMWRTIIAPTRAL
ncbi:MAG TPA: HD domain-containing protein [Vicinamibacterales bacterium]|jgi:hypothetical protein